MMIRMMILIIIRMIRMRIMRINIHCVEAYAVLTVNWYGNTSDNFHPYIDKVFHRYEFVHGISER